MGPPPIPTNSALFNRRYSQAQHNQQQQQQKQQQQQQQSQQHQRPAFVGGVTDPSSSVYDLYGSSVISLQPNFSALKLAPSHPEPYDPASLGLPIPPAPGTGEKNYRGLYSTSGLDMIGILARVAARQKPEIEIGPIDLGCSFLVTDARKFDHPIVYASETFSRLTGCVFVISLCSLSRD